MALAESCDQFRTVWAFCLNTASTPPMACSALEAASMTDLAKPRIAETPATLATVVMMSTWSWALAIGPGPPLQLVQHGQQQRVIVQLQPVRQRARGRQRQLHR